jgi:D-amino peptidase
MKILVACDMEGITGVTNWDQVDSNHPEYPRFRRIMTGEVNAAIEGAFQAGAEQVAVTDGHAAGTNILIEELDPRARLNSGNGSPFAMVQGVQDGADGVFFVGYHARAGSFQAILDHTWSARTVQNLWINDILTGEYGLNGALCGHYGAPVLLVTGDQTACRQALELLGPVETAVVKHATGRMSAELLAPEVTRQMVCEAAARAVSRLRSGTAPAAFRVEEPVRVKVEFTNSEMADKASRLPGAVRTGGRTVEFTSPDMPAAYLGFRAAVALAS